MGISGGSLKPDMTVFVTGKVAVADVKCYWPKTNATVDVDARNVAKYQPIATSYQNKYGSAKVITIMLPTAGPVPMVTLEALKDCGIKAGKATSILRDMMVKVIKGNHKIVCGKAAANPVDEHAQEPEDNQVEEEFDENQILDALAAEQLADRILDTIFEEEVNL